MESEKEANQRQLQNENKTKNICILYVRTRIFSIYASLALPMRHKVQSLQFN